MLFSYLLCSALALSLSLSPVAILPSRPGGQTPDRLVEQAPRRHESDNSSSSCGHCPLALWPAIGTI